MRSFAGACALMLFVSALVPAKQVRARPKSFSLNWVRDPGAESCIPSGELARVIESMFGPVFVAPSDAELAIEGLIWPLPTEGGFRARISVTDRRGVRMGMRELSSAAPSCRSFDAAIALVIGMSIDPELGVAQLPPELLDSLTGEADPGAALLAELHAAEPKPQAESRPAVAVPVVEASTPSQQLTAAPAAKGQPLRVQLEAGYAAGLALLPQLS